MYVLSYVICVNVVWSAITNPCMSSSLLMMNYVFPAQFVCQVFSFFASVWFSSTSVTSLAFIYVFSFVLKTPEQLKVTKLCIQSVNNWLQCMRCLSIIHSSGLGFGYWLPWTQHWFLSPLWGRLNICLNSLSFKKKTPELSGRNLFVLFGQLISY